MLDHVDASLPGRAGMSFAWKDNITRMRPSFTTRLWERIHMSILSTTIFSAIKQLRKIITKYYVKYKLNKWVHEDYNGDGIKDNETSVLETPTILQGTYTTEAEARKAASTQILLWNPSESRTEQQTRSGSLSSLPSSISYNGGGFSGTPQ